ncbi:hypothetical protein [Escherichia coli]|uniref:hypothetical protein n=1 Tax=Escherichia coli TaxID=562 RepID=UPI001F3B490F|nr:hypothetical protein [Escherichia coli]
MQIIIDYLCHAVNTLFGFYQQPFLKEWDDMLNDIIDKGLIMEVDELTIKFNYEGEEYLIWVVIDGMRTVIFIQLVVNTLNVIKNSDHASAQCAACITCI